MYCGYCNSFMTLKAGTSKAKKIYHCYKCFNKKRKKEQCKGKNYPQEK
ncbi:MAG: recombinase zinc beta ribbon domain-containing protein [Christensenellaceae bacterium]|nr:recombinase zinc beta ribbon domain-containing protein [Christensenellaceae bacterium]